MRLIVAMMITMIFMTSMLAVEAAESGEGDYNVTPERITLTSSVTLTGDESSEMACLVDEAFGDDDGVVTSDEVYAFEDYMEDDSESSHSMNSVSGTASDTIVRIQGMTGTCNNGDTITMNIEGIITFDLSGDSSTTYTLKYFTGDDIIAASVSYTFSGYEITSTTGLTNGVTTGNSYEGTREGGTTMIIEFKEESDGVPGFLILPSIAVISFAAIFYNSKRI